MSDGFLSRWSRRKRDDARGDQRDDQRIDQRSDKRGLQPGDKQGDLTERLAPATPPVAVPEPEFDVSILPDIESATAETDFTVFLQKGVPEFLKRQALRRAWSLDPGIRDYAGPADYAWDFNAVDGVPGFSLTLGGDVRKLLAQAIGQLLPEAEAETAPPSFLPPGTIPVSTPPIAADPAPQDPVRLAIEAAPELPLPPGPEVLAEVALPTRRHGSATPG